MDKLLEQRILEKTTKDRIKYYNEHIAMFKLTEEFIIRKNLLMYGGLALNASLPKAKRFYDEYEVPDYDFFSPQAFEDAKELADLYYKEGYKNVEVKPGLHHGTYKLFVEFTPIADMTDVPPQLFRRMQHISSSERDQILKNNPSLEFHIAPMSYLRMSLHLELSRPDGFIERWSKIYKRMVLFYKTYPLKYDCKPMDAFQPSDDERYTNAVDYVKSFLSINLYPAFGSEVLRAYLKEGGVAISRGHFLDQSMTAYDIIAEDHSVAVKKLERYLSKKLGKTTALKTIKHPSLYNEELIPSHYIIYLNNRPLIGVYQARACYAYKESKGLRMVTVDTFLSLMYGWLLAERHYYNLDKVRCAVNMLLHVQEHELNKSSPRSKMFSPFELKCYGYQTKLEDLRREQVGQKNRTQIYRPKHK